MLDITQPEQGTEMTVVTTGKGGLGEQWLRDCQLVQMHDDAVELGNLLKALYDGLYVHFSRVVAFQLISSKLVSVQLHRRLFLSCRNLAFVDKISHCESTNKCHCGVMSNVVSYTEQP